MKCPKEITDLFRTEKYVKEVLKDRMACPSCVTGCKDHVLVKEGKHRGVNPYISSLYGRIMNWGSRCMVDGYKNAMKSQDVCNRTGLCVHSFTSLMDWAVDLYEHGVISKKDTDGIELKRGFDSTMNLMEKTVRREGFGKILAEGWNGAIEAIGKGCEKYAIQIKGTEPLFDPRLHRLGTVEFYQITNPRGGWGSRGRSASYIQKGRPIKEFVAWCDKTGVPEDAKKRIFAVKDKFNVARLTRYAEDWCYLSDTIGAPCMEGRVRDYFDMGVFEKLYERATGKHKEKEEIKRAGERAFVMIKVLNARMGFNRKDDKVPERWFEPIYVDGKEQVFEDYYGNPMSRNEIEKLLDDYYDERGFDVTEGIPTRSKLIELGLGDVAKGFD
jgi:aldehyde:ferredoxin oxidoreductase